MPALNHFRRLLSKHFDDVICIASSAFPSARAEDNMFLRSFTFLYNREIPVMSPSVAARAISQHPAYDQSAPDPFEPVAQADAHAIVDAHEMTADDIIFFPGADFYGVIGFLDILNRLPVERRPSLYIRLIGVLEGATHFYDDPAREFAARIRSAIENGIRVFVSAETPDYADKLAELIGSFTYVTPYPETASQVPLPSSEDFTLLCAGSARLDKGFHFLRDIMQGVGGATTKKRIKLITQTLPVNGSESWDAYTSQLYAMKNVTLLEPILEFGTIESLYRDCDVVLLPYAPDVYKMRGSAVMMEAASVGRMCITLRGTAFAKQVDYYNLGVTVAAISDIPAAVKMLADTPRAILSAKISQARRRFYMDVENSYKNWFGLS